MYVAFFQEPEIPRTGVNPIRQVQIPARGSRERVTGFFAGVSIWERVVDWVVGRTVRPTT